MTLAYKSDAAWNETYHQDPEFDKILVEVRGVTDLQNARRCITFCRKKIHNDNGAIIPIHGTMSMPFLQS